MTTLHPVRSAPPPGTDPLPRGGSPSAGTPLPGVDLLDAVLSGTPQEEQPVTHVHRVPVRDSRTLPWPAWVSPELRARLEAQGVSAPWRHQVEAAQLARDGSHVVVATGTASGKSLAYQLPVFTRLLTDSRATAPDGRPGRGCARRA